jgi:hypothetical protein
MPNGNGMFQRMFSGCQFYFMHSALSPFALQVESFVFALLFWRQRLPHDAIIAQRASVSLGLALGFDLPGMFGL